MPEANSDKAGAAGATTPAIRCVDLTKVFGKRSCVNRLSFTVYPGELYALLGDNGAGKTTTINMLTTLLQPTSGQFFLCGYDGIRQSEHAKSVFGVVSQEVAIYGELTAYENLAFIADLYGVPNSVSKPRIGVLLDQAGLADRAHDLAGEFSTGMQRKLSIAIAMIREPRVIFMDEPTVGLDPASRHQIWESLRELKRKGVTVLLTTHYLEEAELLADRIGIIRQGQMVLEGSIDELRTELRTGRTVTVWMADQYSEQQLENQMKSFGVQHPGSVQFNKLTNALIFTPPCQRSIADYLSIVMSWLSSENLVFDKLAITEPSLEDIFLSVQASGRHS